MFIRFDKMYERDRRTDTAWRLRPCLMLASRSKNQLSIVYNYRTLRHAMAKKWRHFRKAGNCIFIFWVYRRGLPVLRMWQSVTVNDGYSWKKLTLSDEILIYKKIGRYMWIRIFNKFAKFHAKKLTKWKYSQKNCRRAPFL